MSHINFIFFNKKLIIVFSKNNVSKWNTDSKINFENSYVLKTNETKLILLYCTENLCVMQEINLAHFEFSLLNKQKIQITYGLFTFVIESSSILIEMENFNLSSVAPY